MKFTIFLISASIAILFFILIHPILKKNWVRLTSGKNIDILMDAEKNVDAVGSEFRERIGKRVYQYAPEAHIKKIEGNLYWATFIDDKNWSEKTVEYALGYQAFSAFVIGAIGFFYFNGFLGAVIGFAFGFYIALFPLNDLAEKVRKTITSELPEFTLLMAAESAGGGSLKEILNRLSTGSTHIAKWIARVVSKTYGQEAVKGTIDDSPGVLMKESRASRFQDLLSLGNQLSFVSDGVEMTPLLHGLSKNFMRSYLGKATIRAKAVAGKAAIVVVVGFLGPYVIGILILFGIAASIKV